MPIYHYWIRTPSGSLSEGYREAAGEGELRRWFERRRALVLSIRQAGWLQQQKLQLTDQAADQLLHDIADAQSAGLPLDVALASVADVTSDRALARVLRRLAERIGAGLDWQAALDELELPPTQRAILAAASASRRPPEIVLEVLEVRRWLRELLHSVWQTLAYPLGCFLAAIFISCLIMVTCVRQLTTWVGELMVGPTVGVEVAIWWSQLGAWLLLGTLAVLFIAVIMIRWLAGAARWHLFLMTLPIVGPLFQYGAMIPLLRLVSLMLQHGLPLNQALSLALEASGPGANVRHAKRLVEHVSSGGLLADGLANWGPFPRIALPFIRWSEAHGCLADGLDATADYLAGTVRLAAQGARTVLVTLVVFFSVCTVASLVAAIFGPLLLAISALS